MWTMKRIYEGLFLPIITYGAAAWYQEVAKVHVKRKLESAQRIALLYVVKACRTVSTPALQIIADKIPIDLMITFRGFNFRIIRRKPVQWKEYATPQNIRDLDVKEQMKETEKLNNLIKNEWQQRWTHEKRGRNTYQFIPDIELTYTRRWFQPGMKVSFLITGKGSINSSLFQINRSSTPNCVFCSNEAETVTYMLLKCGGYVEFRSEIIKEIINKKNTDESKLQNFVQEQKVFTEFIEYAKNIFEKRKKKIEVDRSASSGQGRAT